MTIKTHIIILPGIVIDDFICKLKLKHIFKYMFFN